MVIILLLLQSVSKESQRTLVVVGHISEEAVKKYIKDQKNV